MRQQNKTELPPREDVEIVARIAQLVNARREGDYLRAADAHHELERLGVLVKFPRNTRRRATGEHGR